MTSPIAHQSLPKVAEVYRDFPLRIIAPLRNIVESPSAKEAFGNYCALFDVLVAYLDDLANSVYVAQPPEAVDERLEDSLRKLPPVLSLGHKVSGLRAFGTSRVDFSQTLPELREILNEKRIPHACIRLTRACEMIRKACEEFGIPPTRLQRYLDEHVPTDNLGKCSLDNFLTAIVPLRNKGHAHLDEDSWFPNDPHMFAVVCGYLAPAVDELLTWAPFQALLIDYEVVRVEAPPLGAARTCPIARTDVADGLVPLGGSTLRLDGKLKPDKGALIIARRTEIASELQALVRHVRFPRTLQSSELLARRYAEVYLNAYLERGLVTPTQRQTKLRPAIEKLALPEPECKRIEGEIQKAINVYSNDEPAAREDSLRQLAGLLGEHWNGHRERVETLLEALPGRRKDYVFEQIYNNAIMSFAQLGIETELNELDLDSVLVELEQEDRVRLINANGQSGRQHSYYKAQDPKNAARLLGLLAELRGYNRRSRGGFPAPLWKVVRLCADLLADDGIGIEEPDLHAYADLFDQGGTSVEPEPGDDDGAMVLRVGDDELRPDSVRELFERVMALLEARGIDPSPAVPMLIGRSRYLVAREPVHGNGTPFKVPMQIGGFVFEGNFRRVRALYEVIRFLEQLGLDASSPDFDQPSQDDGSRALPGLGPDSSDEPNDEAGGERLAIDIFPPNQLASDPVHVEGPTVRRFFAALLDVLLRHEAPLADVVPVATGRVRYLLAEEPYHRNDRPFDSMVEREGYFMNTAYSYEQALSAAEQLCAKLGWPTQVQGRPDDAASDDAAPLRITIGDQVIEADGVPTFFRRAFVSLFEQGILHADDVPHKVGRVRYLISKTPTHDHGREFIRPVEVEVDGVTYYIESNVSRRGAIDLLERLLASKRGTSDT